MEEKEVKNEVPAPETDRKKEEKEKNHASCIEVVNYLVYDENDLLKIKNYRLKEVKA